MSFTVRRAGSPLPAPARVVRPTPVPAPAAPLTGLAALMAEVAALRNGAAHAPARVSAPVGTPRPTFRKGRRHAEAEARLACVTVLRGHVAAK